MGRVKCDHIKRLITLTGDNIKRLSLYFNTFNNVEKWPLFMLSKFKMEVFAVDGWLLFEGSSCLMLYLAIRI